MVIKMSEFRYSYICPACILPTGYTEGAGGDTVRFSFEGGARGTVTAGGSSARVIDGVAVIPLSAFPEGISEVKYTEGKRGGIIQTLRREGKSIYPCDESGE